MSGTVLDFGLASYEFNHKNSQSFFVKLNTNQGEKTLWGIGLEDAFISAGCKVGDNVFIKHTGKESVKLPIKTRNEEGDVTTAFIDGHRNSFEVKKLPSNACSRENSNQSIDSKNKCAEFLENKPKDPFMESLKNVFRGFFAGIGFLTVIYQLFFA